MQSVQISFANLLQAIVDSDQADEDDQEQAKDHDPAPSLQDHPGHRLSAEFYFVKSKFINGRNSPDIFYQPGHFPCSSGYSSSTGTTQKHINAPFNSLIPFLFSRQQQVVVFDVFLTKQFLKVVVFSVVNP